MDIGLFEAIGMSVTITGALIGMLVGFEHYYFSSSRAKRIAQRKRKRLDIGYEWVDKNKLKLLDNERN